MTGEILDYIIHGSSNVLYVRDKAVAAIVFSGSCHESGSKNV